MSLKPDQCYACGRFVRYGVTMCRDCLVRMEAQRHERQALHARIDALLKRTDDEVPATVTTP